ncbi:DUF5331 domain-containing protein [Calothrix rhizosoleniae]|uniref:DUF5331 domain-containing protein n=1 Tax=Calothrix rhizosoleniae TaxID=888997 RepID=UPI0013566452|nr:DUF5331 domain-containing protein [Calothrix rhizosoleniae]
MNIQDLRQSLKLKWLNYYQKNHAWLVKMRVWATYDGERRPLSSFILATLSVLEPKLEQVFPFVLELSDNPDQIVSALGLNFNPEEHLHLIDSHYHTHNNDRTHERSLWENLVYDRQPEDECLSHAEMVDEQAMRENINLMAMLVDEEQEIVNQPVASSVATKHVNQHSPDFVHQQTTAAENFLQPVAVLGNKDNAKTQSMMEEIATPTLPTKISQPVGAVKDYPMYPPTEPPREKIPPSLPLHTFVLDEMTGMFHQTEPILSDVQKSPEEVSPPYKLGETISIPSIAADNQSVQFGSWRENQPQPEGENQPQPEEGGNQEENVSSHKRRRFNLASWVDDFCQGAGWDREDAIILPF